MFRMLRNNADARRCSYFEPGLPVVELLSNLAYADLCLTQGALSG